MSGTMKSLAHSRWDCKYHVVFIPQVSSQGDLRRSKTNAR